MKLVDVSPDLTLTSTLQKAKDAQEAWEEIKTSLDDILEAFDMESHQKRFISGLSVGDMRLGIGWQLIDKPRLSFLSRVLLTVRSGVLLPTGRHRSSRHPFAIENGYNGHWGIPLRFDINLEGNESIHLGIHSGLTVFFHTSRTIRAATTTAQQGIFIFWWRLSWL